MSLNLDTLFAYLRRAPFGNRMTQQQVDGVKAIVADFMETGPKPDLRWLAYILATAFHETGGKMAPVREGFASSDAGARKIVAGRKYGKADADTGEVYYGRGYVQLTWKENYDKFAKSLHLDLVNEPDLALEPKIAATVLVEGMLLGFFTGRSLEMYFSPSVEDAVGARAIINGSDKADLIAHYYDACKGALLAADESTPQPTDVVPEAAVADKPSLLTDKSTIGAVTSAIGAGGASIIGGINNPYAFAAIVVVGIGAILFLTGRLDIRRKAGA